VDIIIPPGSQDTVNTLTLSLGGTEISEKAVYVYVQNAFSKVSKRARKKHDELHSSRILKLPLVCEKNSSIRSENEK